MAWIPSSGSDLIVSSRHVWRDPSTRSDVVLEAGNRLRVDQVDERWDNTHAMIVRGYRFTLRLRALDGPSEGKSIDLVVDGVVIDQLDETFDGITLPVWLGVAQSPASNAEPPVAGRGDLQSGRTVNQPLATASRVVAVSDRAALLAPAERTALAALVRSGGAELAEIARAIEDQHARWLNERAMFTDWETPAEEASGVATRVPRVTPEDDLAAIAAGWAAISVGVATYSCDRRSDLDRLSEPWRNVIAES